MKKKKMMMMMRRRITMTVEMMEITNMKARLMKARSISLVRPRLLDQHYFGRGLSTPHSFLKNVSGLSLVGRCVLAKPSQGPTEMRFGIWSGSKV